MATNGRAGVLNEFIMKNPNLENKKDQRDLQDITHKIVEAVGTIAGSSLEQTTWLRRNLEVKASPQILVEGNNLERDVEGNIISAPLMKHWCSVPPWFAGVVGITSSSVFQWFVYRVQFSMFVDGVLVGIPGVQEFPGMSLFGLSYYGWVLPVEFMFFFV
eukprot:g40222.t1